MNRTSCFVEECRFNNNMKCNASKVFVKLQNNRNENAADRINCENFRPIP